ncbi:hypothetical protein C0992_008950 [Termitomyces sp. T32_za158]|nr:hypothetical protein C0992_008950 [Termitomyces sp. T32_za158]
MGTPQLQYPPLPVEPYLQPRYWGDKRVGPLYGSSISQMPPINWRQSAPHNSHYSQVLPRGLPKTPPQNWHPLPAASARPFALGAYYAGPTPVHPTQHDPLTLAPSSPSPGTHPTLTPSMLATSRRICPMTKQCPAETLARLFHIQQGAPLDLDDAARIPGQRNQEELNAASATLHALNPNRAKPITFQLDSAHVTFAASYLQGIAFDHYTTLLWFKPQNPVLSNWQAFVNKFSSKFEVFDTMAKAEDNLFNLKMHPKEWFTTFIIRFEKEAYKTGWNYNALRYALCCTLPQRIKDVLQLASKQPLYNGYKVLVMQVNQHYWEDHSEYNNAQTQ